MIVALVLRRVLALVLAWECQSSRNVDMVTGVWQCGWHVRSRPLEPSNSMKERA